MPQASSLAADLKKKLGTEVELIEGKSGIFDIAQDGVVRWSKKDHGRFPELQEVLDAIKK